MSDPARCAELLAPGQTRWSIPLSPTTPQTTLLRMLSRALLAGEQTPEDAAARCERTLARRWRWLRPLATRYIAAFAGKTRPRLRDVIAFLQNDEGLQRSWIAG